MPTIQRFSYDEETGEIVAYTVDSETGEARMNSQRQSDSENVVHMPSNTKLHKTPLNLPRGCGYDSKKMQSLKEDILTGSNKVSYRMLLIPTLVICSGIMSILLVILEVYLHVRCHIKSKRLADSSLYYRSPFHVLTSHFCGVCKANDLATKVGQMQDARRSRYDFLYPKFE